MNRVNGLPTLEHATYNCPWRKYGKLRFISHASNDWPSNLLIIIAYARRSENGTRLNLNDNSVGISGIFGFSGILEIWTSSPLNILTIIVAPITLFIKFYTASLISLHIFDWFWLRNIIITEPTMSCELCGGIPGKFNEFKDSVG